MIMLLYASSLALEKNVFVSSSSCRLIYDKLLAFHSFDVPLFWHCVMTTAHQRDSCAGLVFFFLLYCEFIELSLER